jgi:DNA-binding response OmpR family regulator
VSTILYVDDDAALRKVVCKILAKTAHAVVTAPGGHEALRIITDRPIDLLITDVRMPRMTGFELARQAKLLCAGLKVIYVSGHHLESDRAAGPIYGVVLQKPVNAADLLKEVELRLRRH